MQLVNQEKPTHWYRPLGRGLAQPAYEVPKKDGSGMKAVTLREARELGLFPSVTNVLNILNKPALNDWRVEQGILAALSLPRTPDEPLDAFARRVVTDMEVQGQVARDFGSDLHKAIERELTEPSYTPDLRMEPFLKHVRVWIGAEVMEIHGAELCVADNAVGFAGKLDLDCTLRGAGRAIVDFKSQRVKGKAAFYEDWPIQLAAYARARKEVFPEQSFALVSVVIDSNTPGPVHIKVWDHAEEHWAAFLHAFLLWEHLKGYRPARAAEGVRLRDAAKIA